MREYDEQVLSWPSIQFVLRYSSESLGLSLLSLLHLKGLDAAMNLIHTRVLALRVSKTDDIVPAAFVCPHTSAGLTHGRSVWKREKRESENNAYSSAF